MWCVDVSLSILEMVKKMSIKVYVNVLILTIYEVRE